MYYVSVELQQHEWKFGECEMLWEQMSVSTPFLTSPKLSQALTTQISENILSISFMPKNV